MTGKARNPGGSGGGRDRRARRAFRGGGRWVLALALLVAATGVVPVAALASPEEDLAEAQKRANAAAAELTRAEVDLAGAEDAVVRIRARVDRIEARVGAARQQLGQLALYRYVDGTARVTRLFRLADANEVVRAQQFSHIIAGGATDALERYRAEKEDLDDELDALRSSQRDRTEAIDELRDRSEEAIEEVDRLARVVREQTAQAQRAQAQRARPSEPGQPTPDRSPVSRPSADATPAPEERTQPRDPEPEPEVAVPTPEVEAGAWVCPVMQPRAFSNDWGAPRGGGYSHEGNDILAPRGTPVVANVDGVVSPHESSLGGLSYYLEGDDGNTYFGAHLDSYGASGRVSAGTVIGAVGDTGDARGGPPHLHFEMHPGGGGPVNPYPMLSRYC